MVRFDRSRKFALTMPLRRGLCAAIGAVVTVASLGCAAAPAAPAAPTVTRAAAKTTCSEVVPGWLPDRFELEDRRLVPLSETLLGVAGVYRGTDDTHVSIASGGYLDDILEPYDDLRPIGTINALGDTAELSSGSYVGRSTAAAAWSASGLDPPCATRAVVAIGIPLHVFRQIVERLEIRAHSQTDP